MKIKEYQSGGIIYTPFITSRSASQPIPVTGTPTTSTKKTSSGADAIQKEIIDVLKENGLQNDVNEFLDKANSFLNSSRNLSTMSLFGGKEDEYTMSHLIGILQLANGVKRNKGQYDNAITRLRSEKAEHEAAMTSSGDLYVIDENNKMQTISASDYYENRNKYRPLTNSQVLYLREKDPSLSYREDILNDIEGAISMKTVSDQILDEISKIGEISRGEYIKQTGNQISQSAWDGMRILIDQGPDGYYKVTTKSEKENLNAALMYLWRSLGDDGQKKLTAECATQGLNPVTNKYDMIMQALDVFTNYSQDPSFDASATKSEDEKKAAAIKTEPLERLAAFAAGKGERETIAIVPRSSEIGQRGTAFVTAMNFGNMIDDNDNTLPAMSVASLRTKAEYFKAAFNQDVTFGGQVLQGGEENAVLWDGKSQVAQVWLPYTRVNGQITPDFDVFFRYMDYVKEFSENPNMPATQVSKLISKYGLNGMLENNMMELKDTMCFMTFSGYAHDDAIDFTEATERMTEKVSRHEGSQIAQLYENASKYGDTNPSKKAKKLYNFDTINAWDKNDFRKGNIFIPIKSSFLGTYSSMRELVPESIVNNFHHRATLAKGTPTISGQFN